MKKDCLSEVLRCWIEEIEERRLVTEGPTWSPTPPTFLDISALPTRTTTVPNATGKSIKRNTTKFTLKRPICNIEDCLFFNSRSYDQVKTDSNTVLVALAFSELLHLSLFCRNDLSPALPYKMFSLFFSFCPCCSLLNI